ncbi:MAG: DUF4830 domain-containing protein [Clostridia bacterium]|nr:DUF4830 domain-containing protein [Clostridia bacterium]
MFIYSVKGSTLKFFGALSLSLLVLVLLVIFVPSYDSASLPTGQEVEYSGIKTNEDRVNFLSRFGWTVEKEPILEEDVTIPADFDSVFSEYNNLQKTQGLDLAKYKRKGVKHYRYKLTNHKSEGTVYANLLIYRGRVIGGDISSAAMNGFVYGFRGEELKTPTTSD